MQPILSSNDPVELSWARAVLADAGIEAVLLDEYTAAAEGSILAIPRRLMVADGAVTAATVALAVARAQLEEAP
ncbi:MULTISPECIES: DUF2007 domain-containing protein [Nitrospirillum]|uniref:Putative signal transducing protein n=1 Tax=Nitrospirillum amazonense TaxID=28077 RepID=A0A560HI93_9PROT|nr:MULTISPECIES: DUF2007 domain-containing protein [Nitrospirillum]MDZ5649330.1 DUF2007 domain-containing protein [Nitrospirillum sp. BR 11828]MEE3623378.1 DUF2007 domain-containing protein [Nitrospirillum sp. BR 11752]TWB45721.1 putative signal transducing protein [Nitrospirillum amazonense]